MDLLELIRKSLEQNQDRDLIQNTILLKKFDGFINHTVTQIDLCHFARLARNEAKQIYYTNHKQLRYKAYILQDVCQSIINLTDLDYQECSDEELEWLYNDNFEHELSHVKEITKLFN